MTHPNIGTVQVNIHLKFDHRDDGVTSTVYIANGRSLGHILTLNDGINQKFAIDQESLLYDSWEDVVFAIVIRFMTKIHKGEI